MRALAENITIHTKNMRHFAQDIKIGHSVFALPFALSAFLVSEISPPNFSLIVWTVVCMISARSFAMGMNRLLDRDIDRQNPRTASRKIPSGQLSVTSCACICGVLAAIFIFASFRLSALAFYCSIPLLCILAFYPLAKRFTSAAHWYLGFCLGLSPLAVQIAFEGSINFPIIILGTGIMFWTAGFDILYALQDRDWDLRLNLSSIPSRFGIRSALAISKISFAFAVSCFVFLAFLADFGVIYWLGIAAISLIMSLEHWALRRAHHELSTPTLNAAFFRGNASISIVFFAAVLFDRILA
jgi:4-hydroxybenzoate polyprenyltransferase